MRETRVEIRVRIQAYLRRATADVAAVLSVPFPASVAIFLVAAVALISTGALR